MFTHGNRYENVLTREQIAFGGRWEPAIRKTFLDRGNDFPYDKHNIIA
jgi:hypothetical protein